jgi:hypothetical protein
VPAGTIKSIRNTMKIMVADMAAVTTATMISKL